MNTIISAYNEVNEFGREHGLKLKVISKGHVEYRMTLLKKHEALPNYTHGGLIAGVADQILGAAALTVSSEENKQVATLDLQIQFLNSAHTGATLVGTGLVTKAGKSIIFARGEIREEGSDELIATTTGTFKAYPRPEKS